MFVAGIYVVSYAAGHVGITQRGFDLEHVWYEEPIIGDVMGDSKLDGVYTGGDCFWNATLQEYNAPRARHIFWPWSANFGAAGLVGRVQGDTAGALILTVVAGSRAATTGPTTLTAPLSILPGNFPIRMLFAPRLRNVPIRLQALPASLNSQSPGNEYWFQIT